jgi:hypothetical protein
VGDTAQAVAEAAGPDSLVGQAAGAVGNFSTRTASGLVDTVKTVNDFNKGVVEGAVDGVEGLAKGVVSLGDGVGKEAFALATDEKAREQGAQTLLHGAKAVLHGANAVANFEETALTDPSKAMGQAVDAAGSAVNTVRNVASKVGKAYQEAAAKGHGGEFIGKGVGQAAVVVAGAVVTDGASIAGEGAAVAGEGVALAGEGVAVAGEGAAVVGEGAVASGEAAAVSGEGAATAGEGGVVTSEGAATGAEGEAAAASSGGPSQLTDNDVTVTDGVVQDPAPQSGEALADDDAGGRDGLDTIPDGAPVDDATTVTDGVVQDPTAESGEAVAEGDPGAKTQEGAPTDDATPLLGGPPADIDAVVSSASDKVQAMTDEDLAGLTNDEKNQLVKNLTTGGDKPTGDAQDALRKVYRSMEPDPTFRAKDDLRMRDAADSLTGDEDLKAAKANWDSLGTQDRVNALKKVVDAQSKAYGVTPPKIETYLPEEVSEDGLIENGKFNPRSGKILLNAAEENPALQDFDKAVDLVSHENAHAYQQRLVDRFNSGELRPGDDEYEQAAMFAVNNRPGAYIKAESSADVADYEMQPMEQHAFRTGAIFSNVIADGL